MSSASRRRFSMKHPAVVVDVGCGCRRRKLSSLLSYFQRRTKLHPRGGAAAAAAAHNSLSTSPSSGAATSLWASTGMTNSSSSFYSACHEESAASPVAAQATEKGEKRRRRSRKKRAEESAVAESVEVVKESSEPYADFKESMVQMIVENEIYSSEELDELLHRFLLINSPRHHHVILRAFADLWPAGD